MSFPILSGNVATATAATGYNVDNSCMFNDGDSAYMHKTPTSAGSRRKWTFSAWIKRGQLGTSQYIFNSKNGSADQIFFNTSDKFQVGLESITADYVTTAAFKDISAWYHFVAAVDTEQGTAANRVRVYVNGTEVTSFSTETNPNQNTDTTMNTTVPMELGRRIANTSDFFDGYMAEVVFIDGTQYAASDFGEFNEDSPTIWQPKDVSGLTFGTNGFYLDFEASDNLGNDANGGTDLTEVNLAATDQMLDTCTNNFCTMNPLDQKVGGTYTFSEGNLQVEQDVLRGSLSNFGITAGKWYAEAKFVSTNSDSCRIGIVGISNVDNDNPGKPATGYVYDQDGNKSNNNTAASYGDTYSTGDIIGIAVDLTNLKIYFSKNGTFQDSGDPTSGSTGTGAAYTITAASGTPAGAYFFTHCDNADKNKVFWNFGSPAYSISSGNADDNGYGNFEYDVPAGYLSLCTKNLGSDGG